MFANRLFRNLELRGVKGRRTAPLVAVGNPTKSGDYLRVSNENLTASAFLEDPGSAAGMTV